MGMKHLLLLNSVGRDDGMGQLKKIGMAAGTFSVALGIGFVMQNGDALASRFGNEGNTVPVQFSETNQSVETSEANLFGATPIE